LARVERLGDNRVQYVVGSRFVEVRDVGVEGVSERLRLEVPDVGHPERLPEPRHQKTRREPDDHDGGDAQHRRPERERHVYALVDCREDPGNAAIGGLAARLDQVDDREDKTQSDPSSTAAMIRDRRSRP